MRAHMPLGVPNEPAGLTAEAPPFFDTLGPLPAPLRYRKSESGYAGAISRLPVTSRPAEGEYGNLDRTIQSAIDGGSGDPTRTVYPEFAEVYDHFNRSLFANCLPRCLITLPRCRRRTYGYFWANRFGSADGRNITDEVALNSRHLRVQSTEDVLSTLVHEMHHLAQHRLSQHFGKAGRGRYHNRAFARAMRASGLICSDTGRPGGKETGECMSHYIVPGGAFDVACQALIDQGFSLPCIDLVEAERSAGLELRPTNKAASKTRYTCPGCALHAWAKPRVRIVCERSRLSSTPPIPC